MSRHPRRSQLTATLCPYTSLFRSIDCGHFFISAARPASALGRRLMRLGEALAFERRLRVFARGRVGAIFVAIAVEVAHHIPAFLGGLDDREDVEIAR